MAEFQIGGSNERICECFFCLYFFVAIRFARKYSGSSGCSCRAIAIYPAITTSPPDNIDVSFFREDLLLKSRLTAGITGGLQSTACRKRQYFLTVRSCRRLPSAFTWNCKFLQIFHDSGAAGSAFQRGEHRSNAIGQLIILCVIILLYVISINKFRTRDHRVLLYIYPIMMDGTTVGVTDG